MADDKPAGPRPLLVVGLLAGVGLLLGAWWHPTIHMLWQLPLGLFLAVSSMGKMVSR